MSEATTTIITAGVVQIALGLIAYFSLRAKLKYSTDKTDAVSRDAMATVRKADSAVERAGTAVERADFAAEKADTAAKKADTVAQRSSDVAASTEGKVDVMINKLDANTALTKVVAKAIDGHDGNPNKLEALEDYAHDTKHDLKNDINVLSLKMVEVSLKLDINTNLTREARVAAETAATKAEQAADKAEHAVVEKVALLQDIQRHVNGGLREAMDSVLNPIRDELERMNAHRGELAREVQAIREEQSRVRGASEPKPPPPERRTP